MEIGSLNTDYIVKSASDASVDKMEDKLKRANKSGSSEEELLDACKQFEAYFYEQIFKKMEEAMVPGKDESDPNNTLVGYYKDSLIQEYSKSAANQQENSLAQMLFEQMKRNYDI